MSTFELVIRATLALHGVVWPQIKICWWNSACHIHIETVVDLDAKNVRSCAEVGFCTPCSQNQLVKMIYFVKKNDKMEHWPIEPVRQQFFDSCTVGACLIQILIRELSNWSNSSVFVFFFLQKPPVVSIVIFRSSHDFGNILDVILSKRVI